jgi:cobalt/nickel transport system permease protein
MHIPDGFLAPPVWAGMDVVSAGFVGCTLRHLNRHLEEKAIPLMGVLAAFVFAAQMINVPVAGGTSGHVLGGALVGILLGPAGGLMVMTVVLIVQCLLFQDGGIAALGANIFNMGVLGSALPALLYRLIVRSSWVRRSRFWAGFLSAFVTIVASALSCAAMLSLSSVVRPALAFSVIGGVHVLVGILEGLVTGTILESLARTRPDLLQMPSGIAKPHG